MDNMSGSLGFGTDQKAQIMNKIRQEAALQNARQLIEKINEHCFDKCVPKPGASFSSSEQSCFTQCMEKYMMAWNTVSKQYISRIQQESGKAPSDGSMF